MANADNPNTEHQLSPLEALPFELVSQLIEFAPESVLRLRLASRTMQTHVELYAKIGRINISLVDRLIFTSQNSSLFFGNLRPSPIVFTMSFCIAKGKSALFRLRLVFQELLSEFVEDRDNKFCKSVFVPDIGISFEIIEDHVSILECFRKVIGRRIKIVENDQCGEKNQLELLSKILEGTTVDQFTSKHQTLTDVLLLHLSTVVKKRHILHLTLHFYSASEEFAKFLIDLASNLRSLVVSNEFFALDMHRLRKYQKLGTLDLDWASLILEMFSRRLDKLCLKNFTINLSGEGVNNLVEILLILGKKIWFEVNLSVLSNSLNFIKCDHHVIVDWAVFGRTIECSIKHSSRVDENVDSFSSIE